MNIVRENNRSGARVFHNAIAHRARTGSAPIERIDIPENDFVAELLMDPFFLMRRNRSIRWTHQGRTFAHPILNGVVRFT